MSLDNDVRETVRENRHCKLEQRKQQLLSLLDTPKTVRDLAYETMLHKNYIRDILHELLIEGKIERRRKGNRFLYYSVNKSKKP